MGSVHHSADRTPPGAQAALGMHVCDSRVPVCSCGWRWDYRMGSGEVGDPYRYTSAAVIERYRALYGEHPDAVQIGGRDA